MVNVQDGLKIQKNPDTGIEHHLYPDGRDVQVNPVSSSPSEQHSQLGVSVQDGSKIEHFADGTTRQITKDGENVDLKKVVRQIPPPDTHLISCIGCITTCFQLSDSCGD